MTTVIHNVTIPYEDLMAMKADSATLKSVIELVKTEFPDDTCQLIAIKSVLGIDEGEPVEEIPGDEPADTTE